MKWFCAALVLSSSVLGAEPVLDPYVFRASFEDGSVGPWSSYPPAQDTAYDPTIWVKPLAHAVDVDNRALYREIKPVHASDISFGVRKLLDMFVDGESRLTFRTALKAANGTDGVRVRLAFADGTGVDRIFSVASDGVWADVEWSFSDVFSAGERKQLEAIAFVALCPRADTESLYRFGVDDVALSGMRERPWRFLSPRAHELEEWRDRIAARHFDENETLRIRARAPVDAPSAVVRVSRALTGEDELVLEMARSGGEWSFELPLAGRAGLWRAELEARDADGRSAETSLVFLVARRDAPSGHPCLFMAQEAREELLEEALGPKRATWDAVRSAAVRSREEHDPDEFEYNLDAYDETHWLPTYGGYVASIGTPGRYIRDNAVVYALSGDREAGEAARRALVKMAAWPTFVHPHILNQGQFTYWPVGLVLIDLAVGFDMVYDLFEPEERRAVADTLFRQGVRAVSTEYVLGNRVSSNTSNWISHVTGGGILSALAIETESEYSAEQLEPHLTGMILKLGELVNDTFGEDGNYGEGYSYANFTMQTLGETLPALERVFGIRFPEKIGRAHRFLLYQMDVESSRIYDFGDTNDHFFGGLPSFTNFAYALGKWRDPYLKWLYDRSPGRSDRDLFFADLDVEARPPDDLPPSVLFRDVGTAVFRSGFEPEDFVFVFRAGPFFNHQHFDQGSFFIADRGEALVVEVGKTDYYQDPWYQPLAIQAGGHNTVLFDHNPASQRAGDLAQDVAAWRDHASITDFLTWEGGGFVSARLEGVYGDSVESLRRSALWLAPRTILLIDRARGVRDAETIQLRFHAPRREDVHVRGKRADIVRRNATLIIDALAPTRGDWQVKKRPLTLSEFGEEDPLSMKARGFLERSVTVDNGAATFIHVLSTDRELVRHSKTERASDHTVWIFDGTRYLVNTSPDATLLKDGIVTDALVYADTPTGRIVLHATKLVRSGTVELMADAPLSLVLGDSGFVFSTNQPTRLSIRLDTEPGNVLVQGKVARDWTYDSEGELSLALPAGNGRVEIR